MRPILAGLVAVLPLACTTHVVSDDSSRQLNADRRFAHDSNGDILYGPSDIGQRVVGQRDPSGNVHVATARWFLSRADELSCAQAKLAELAGQRALSLDVKRMARQLAADQKDLCFRVEWTARQRGLKLESPRDRDAIYTYQRLASLDGASFDRAYVTTALDWQQRQLALWDDVIQTVNEPDVARFANETAPLLRIDHAIAARQLDRM